MYKSLKPKLLLILLVAMIHLDGHGGGGNGFRVLPPETLGESIDPVEPGAFENFTLILSVGYPFSDGTESVDLEVFDGTVRVEVPTGSGFTGGSTLGTDIQGLPAGEYTVKFFSNGHEYASTINFTVADAPPVQPGHTFYHRGINHYFVTADEDERDQVINNGWDVADRGFNVWPKDGPAPEAAVPVCRFYSYEANSHFYTASEEECDHLQSFDSGWDYEGVAFQALVPVANACSYGTEPVWRLYNDRAGEQDSNHRFLTSAETYRIMIAAGWIGEGVAFCSPLSSGESGEG